MTRFYVNLVLLLGLWLPAFGGEPAITFESMKHDFGNIREAKGPVNCSFAYKNTGNAPLVIITVTTPCDCTTSEFSPRPLAPGKSGKINITFDPKGRSGEFSSIITVRTNIPGPGGKKKKETLTISGNVIPKK